MLRERAKRCQKNRVNIDGLNSYRPGGGGAEA